MPTSSRSSVRPAALSLVAALLLALPTRAPAQQWTDGSASMVPHVCTLPVMGSLPEQLVWTWVGYQSPAVVGQVYWMHIVIGALGCSGIYAVPEVRLPPGTTFAIDAAHPITCLYKDPRGQVSTIIGGDCPTAPRASIYPYLTGFSNLGNTNGLIYGLAAGTSLEIRFPVVSSAALSGMAGNHYLLGAVNVQDLNTGSVFWDGADSRMGTGLPNQGPWQGVFVYAAGAAVRPTIRYVEPTLVSVTPTTAVTAAEITSAGCGAQVAYELYPADGTTDTTTFNAAGSSCAWNASAPFSCALAWGGLIGGKTYKWRVYDWTPAAGQPASCARSNVVGLPAAGDTTTGWRYFTAPDPAKPVSYSLVASGNNGTVALSPAGGAYAAGTSVSVTATPKAGYAFSGWLLDGVAAGSANPIAVTMNAAHTLEALFAPVRYTLAVTTSGTGGTVSLAPAQADYAAGQVVQATAAPGAGVIFTGWLLDGVAKGTAATLSVTMDGNHALRASFAPQPAGFLVTVQVAGTGGSGTVSLSPAGGVYAAGTTVTATATPDAGSTFLRWLVGGQQVGSTGPYTFQVNGALTLTAAFAPPASTLRTVTASASGTGSVAITPPGGSYADGASITVTASPGAGQQLSGWSVNGALWPSSANPLVLTVSGDMTVQATFQATTPGGGGGGGGDGDGGGCSSAGGAGLTSLVAAALALLARRRPVERRSVA